MEDSDKFVLRIGINTSKACASPGPGKAGLEPVSDGSAQVGFPAAFPVGRLIF
jgi:hypothetical protein